MTDTSKMLACKIAWETADAASADIWGPVMWTQAAQMLLDMGCSEKSTAQILRSKITRWARDHFEEPSTWLGELATMVNLEREATVWQPIETAPKDSTVIDLWHARLGRCRDCWWDYLDNRWVGPPDDDVTHWMPLPPPPVTP